MREMIFVEYEEKQGNEAVKKSARFKTESDFKEFLSHNGDAVNIVSATRVEVVVGLDLSDLKISENDGKSAPEVEEA